MFNFRKIQAFTLIEAMIATVMIGIAGVGLMNAMVFYASRGVHPLVQKQALILAQSYMEEILSRAYPHTTTCKKPSDLNNRTTYSSICQYGSLGQPTCQPATAEDGSALPAPLSNYCVQVTLTCGASYCTDQTVENLGTPATLQISNTSSTGLVPKMIRVDVKVTVGKAIGVLLSSYKVYE